MNKEALISSLYKISEAKVAVIGDIVLDKYTYGKIERVNPENPTVPILKKESEEYRLGCAANVAANVLSLGANNVVLCGVIGNDYYGKILENLCDNIKLNRFLINEESTIVKERFYESEFNEYMLRVDDGEKDLRSLSTEAYDKIYNFVEKLNLDVIVLSDYNKKVFTNGLGKSLVGLANSKNIPLIVDPKPPNALSFTGSTLFKPNKKEAGEITGCKDEDGANVARRLYETIKSKYVVVTCGKKGAVCYDGKEFAEVPTKVREKVDVTGAGDTVSAAITLGLAAGLSLVEATYLANYAAGIVVEKRGTSVAYRDELIERIRNDN